MIRQWAITGYHLADSNVISKWENIPTYNDIIPGFNVTIKFSKTMLNLIIVYGDRIICSQENLLEYINNSKSIIQ